MTQEIVFILDRSGSMRGSENDTIGGYNSFVQRQQAEKGSAVISTILFDHECSILHDCVDLQSARPMTTKDYSVRGRTALLDAVGRTIEMVKARTDSTPQGVKESEHSAIFVIITDGMENASREYTHRQVRNMIEEQQKAGWEFVFLGADLTHSSDADLMGIRQDRRALYSKDKSQMVYAEMSDTISTFRKTKQMPKDWDAGIKGDARGSGHNIKPLRHQLVTLDTCMGKAIIDTGSPVSFGAIPYMEICGHRHPISNNPLITEIQNHLGTDIVAIIGMDILTTYNLVLEYNEEHSEFQTHFSTEHFFLQGTQFPLRYFMGIPVMEIAVNGNATPCFLDTGSAITYVSEELIRGLPPTGSREGFYPLMGTFTTQTYAVQASILGLDCDITAGVLPTMLSALLPPSLKGIIGVDLLKSFRLELGFRSGKYGIQAIVPKNLSTAKIR